MLKGSKRQAIIAISEFIIQSVKHGFSAKNPQCWSWNCPSERELLETITRQATDITMVLLEDFQELPIDFVFGKIPKTKYLAESQKLFFQFYLKHSFSAKKAQIQSRYAKKFFEEKLKLLTNQWSEQNDRGKTESKKNGKGL